MAKSGEHKFKTCGKKTAWIIGFGSLLWLIIRSGANQRRLAYPCQRAALIGSLGFIVSLVSGLLSVFGTAWLYLRLRRGGRFVNLFFIIPVIFLSSIFISGDTRPKQVQASLSLSGWTSPSAISNVFVVQNIPEPKCSLDGGSLPSTSPCNNPDYALRDIAVDTIVNEMEQRGDYFYKTTSHTTGIIGSNDIVVIKINNQWGLNGTGDGLGRLTTNTDLLKGLIYRILQHPSGFTGEVVVAENVQDSGATWDTTPANSQDRNQSYQDVVNAFSNLGYPVSISDWNPINYSRISGGDVTAGGYPTGEYANGNSSDAYILLEDSEGTGTNELSYPKFMTSGGTYVSMRYGIWNGSSYEPDRLTFINMPVLKRHGMAGATIAWKNLIGFVTVFEEGTRYSDWDTMHDFFWGYTEGTNKNYGLIGREMALIRTPDLNMVDAIWIADDNYDGNATRHNILLPSKDPFAVDWYASEYILRQILSGIEYPDDLSAARNGIFRNATRTNQNSAEAKWTGTYPYIDILDSYNGSTPSSTEKNQMNVYVSNATAKVFVPLMLLLE
jgi:hypothetical protein